MARKQSLWVFKKSNKQFISKYVGAGDDWVFQLRRLDRIITFESWQAAVKQGWRKL
jgi:hypothetical protein